MNTLTPSGSRQIKGSEWAAAIEPARINVPSLTKLESKCRTENGFSPPTQTWENVQRILGSRCTQTPTRILKPTARTPDVHEQPHNSNPGTIGIHTKRLINFVLFKIRTLAITAAVSHKSPGGGKFVDVLRESLDFPCDEMFASAIIAGFFFHRVRGHSYHVSLIFLGDSQSIRRRRRGTQTKVTTGSVRFTPQGHSINVFIVL